MTKRIFIQGIKGGVGATSIAANLASVLAKRQEPAYIIDLCSKNELRLHLGGKWNDDFGWAKFSAKTWPNAFYKNSDNVYFLPHGAVVNADLSYREIINSSKNLDIPTDAWVLFDCPHHIDITSIPVTTNELIIKVINCDASCHSLMFTDLINNQSKSNEFFLINRFNSLSQLEVDLYQLWRSKLKNITPFFIHQDEIIKEALAYKNVAINCAPDSVAIDDMQALASWVVHKLK